MELLTAYQQPVHVELKMHRVYEELVRCAVPKKETGFSRALILILASGGCIKTIRAAR
jgi:hypothetical protein